MNKIIALFLILTSVISSQELNCKVTVNYEQVRVANRERLVDFANVVQNYLNTARYTNEDYATKIDCAMSIFFLSAVGDFDYSVQVVVTSQRPVYRSERVSPVLTINDGQWQFRYEIQGMAAYDNLALDKSEKLSTLLSEIYGFIDRQLPMETEIVKQIKSDTQVIEKDK
jgi:hypothetical protein